MRKNQAAQLFKVDVRNQQAFPEVQGRKLEQCIEKYQKKEGVGVVYSWNNGSVFLWQLNK